MRFLYLACVTFLYCIAYGVQATEPVSNSLIGKTAIGGHSSPAYHQSQQAIKGKKQFAYEWRGAQWLFANAQEKNAFVASPSEYAPAYNGFCANALSLGEGLVKTNGKHWRIIDGRLYLFYSTKGRERWGANAIEYIGQADVAWQEELNKQN